MTLTLGRRTGAPDVAPARTDAARPRYARRATGPPAGRRASHDALPAPALPRSAPDDPCDCLRRHDAAPSVAPESARITMGAKSADFLYSFQRRGTFPAEFE